MLYQQRDCLKRLYFHPLGGLTGKNECRNFAAK